MFSKKIVKNIAIFIIAAAFFAVIFIVAKRFGTQEYKYKKDFFSMDTVVSVRSQSDIAEEIADIFSQYSLLLDKNNENSDTYMLNKSSSILSSQLSTAISDILSLNNRYSTLTDITVGRLTTLWDVTSDTPQLPSDEKIRAALNSTGIKNIKIDGDSIHLQNNCQLDFGAVGKGIVLDKCHEYLSENNCERTLISTGSSMLFWNMGTEKVSIINPDGGILAEVSSDYSFLSTSGGYERYFEADGKTYCHIIDPQTGYPTETDLTTVTVFCENGLLSDFLSTAIFIDGSKNIEKYLQSNEYKIFAADKNKKLYISDGLEYKVYDNGYRE